MPEDRSAEQFEEIVAAALKVDPTGLSGKHRREGVAVREPVEITWHRNRPGQYQLIYETAPLEPCRGGRAEAAMLAEEWGFVMVTDEDSYTRWVKDAEMQPPSAAR